MTKDTYEQLTSDLQKIVELAVEGNRTAAFDLLEEMHVTFLELGMDDTPIIELKKELLNVRK